MKQNTSTSTASDTARSAKAGTLNFFNVTVLTCVRIAYDVKPSQMEAPGWLDAERYDITAKAAGPSSDGEIRLMLRTLLAERFHMAVHRETRMLSAYSLTVSKTGAKLKASEPGARIWNDSRNGHLDAHGMSIADFTDVLADRMDRPVADATGLSGRYEIALDWTPEDSPAASDGTGTSIFAALENVGLKLVPRKAPVDMLVVDHAQKIPTENERLRGRL